MAADAPWAPDPVDLAGRPGEGLRLAVAGAAHWHLPRHAEHLRRAGASFAGVYDPDPVVAQRWATELGCAALPDLETLAHRARPDAVLALGRVCDMAEQAVTLLDAGLPLLAEKPLGLHAGEAERVAAVARARHGWVSVALVRRYDPLWRLLDEAHRVGDLGALTHMHLRLVNGPPQRYAAWGSGWMLKPATAGGGALLNLGIHGVDFFRHLVREPVQVDGAAITFRAHEQAVEDFGAVILRSASGVVGTVEAGYTYPDSSAGMTRSGDNDLLIATSRHYWTARDAEIVALGRDAPERVVPEGQAGDRYVDWIFDSLARLRAGRPPVATADDCLAAVRLIDAAYARAGRPTLSSERPLPSVSERPLPSVSERPLPSVSERPLPSPSGRGPG